MLRRTFKASKVQEKLEIQLLHISTTSSELQADRKLNKFGTIGKIKVKVHREIQGEMMTVTIVKDVDQWFVALSVKGPEQQQ